MKRLAIAIPVAAAVAAAAAGASGAFSSGHGGHAAPRSGSPMPMPMPAASHTATGPMRVELHHRVVRVKIMNFAFQPARVEVSPGTRVVWTNEDSDPHTVTTDRRGFSSQALDTGQKYAQVMGKAGTVTYHCTIHPFMHGAVVVEG